MTARERSMTVLGLALAAIVGAVVGMIGGCAAPARDAGSTSPGRAIVVAGERFPIDAPVVLWSDPGGYDAYREGLFFARPDSTPASEPGPRFGVRAGLPDTPAGGWTVPDVRRVVDQVVIHYDATGTSRACFRVLHDVRGLSAHFLVDLDGTVYQTLDVQERAWHATIANDRSVGVEIANIGAYPPSAPGPLTDWYEREPDGRTRVVLPPHRGDGGVRTPGFVARPARPDPIVGEIHGRALVQYDLTDAQYQSLRALVDALRRALPGIRPDAPRGPDERVLARVLTEEEFEAFSGVLGHFHVQTNKVDPGPAFDWDRVVGDRDASGPGARSKPAP